MTMMTAEQYEESLGKLNLVVYMFGECVNDVVGNPISRNSQARWCSISAISTAIKRSTGD